MIGFMQMHRLVQLPVCLSDDMPSFRETALIDAAAALAAQMQSLTGDDRIPALVTSSGLVAWRFLNAAAALCETDKPRFCEWGSGIGSVSCLAALRGWKVTGIEIEPRLVAVARKFAADHGVTVRFVEGSYRPDALYGGGRAETSVTDHDRFDPFAFDIIYIYAWPAEKQAVTEMIARHGRSGTIFMRYGGGVTCEAFRVVASPEW